MTFSSNETLLATLYAICKQVSLFDRDTLLNWKVVLYDRKPKCGIMIPLFVFRLSKVTMGFFLKKNNSGIILQD